ncbi:MAG: MaoC/PaaZ C-terminal domain-containing protein [Roseicyclus sp.]
MTAFAQGYNGNSMYFEDLAIGRKGRSPARTVTEHDIGVFAGLTGDHAALHTDAVYAADTEFGGRIAHGMLTLALTHGLMVRAGYNVESGLALLGWDNVSFRAPVRIGDTVTASWETIDLRESGSRPNAGIVRDRVTLTNQDGIIVLIGEVSELVRKRAEAG